MWSPTLTAQVPDTLGMAHLPALARRQPVATGSSSERWPAIGAVLVWSGVSAATWIAILGAAALL